MTKALARFAVVDSRRWIRFLLELLPKLDNTDFAALSPVEKRMLQMFYVTLWGKTAESWEDEEVLDNLYALSDSPVLLGELQALLQYQYDRIDFIDEPVDVGFDCPLDLHCTYTRDQLLVALDFLKPATVREGVKWLPEKQLDVFFVTLNKADKDYSPTTMYKDYSINESLFHWQSEHHRRKLCHRAALHPSPGKRKPGAAVRARVQGRGPFWRCRSVYLSGHGELCETRGLPPHEYHMAAEPPNPCKVSQKDQQAGGRLKGEYHEGCSRCCSCDLRRYSDET